jgi:hypothetical protein
LATLVLAAVAILSAVAHGASAGVAPDAQVAAGASCSSPASTVRAWVAAWKAKDFKRMVALSEVSWRLRTTSPVQTLRAQYGFKNALSYRFVRCSANAYLLA